MSLPFEDSRRLTGASIHFDDTGAALETLGVEVDDEMLDGWRVRIERARSALGWPLAAITVRRHRAGASLAFAAPLDQLLCATEVNEWAWLAAVVECGLNYPPEVAEPSPSSALRAPSPEGRREAGVASDAEFGPRAAAALSSPFSLREKVPEGRMREAALERARTNTRAKLPMPRETLTFARQLRASTTPPEQRLWSILRNRRFGGQKFRRQVAMGPYVLDFYCAELKLAVELDGGQHNDQPQRAHDQVREQWLHDQGIKTVRYWNNAVQARFDEVLEDLWNEAHEAVVQPKAVAGSATTLELPHAPAHPAAWDEASALQTLRLLAKEEARPDIVALATSAAGRRLPWLLDDEMLTLGSGRRGRSWALDGLPTPQVVPWAQLGAVPTAAVTGSNGKTTTVRLLAAIAHAHGWRCGYSSTDGLMVNGEAVQAGDYSGPVGARTVLRRNDIDAAILETARGGMLRRGLALQRADVAVVTNVSADHFGEYGIFDLDDLATVKLGISRLIDNDGLLVLNGDDALLRSRSTALTCPLGWFGLDIDSTWLRDQAELGRPVCAPESGRLVLLAAGRRTDLGEIAAMPLAVGGSAGYNIANIAGAALAASALCIPGETIATVLARFGAAHDDNPGRLQRVDVGGVRVLLDYAHNPEGLAGLLTVARSIGGERLALLLGQAGNREAAEIAQLAAVAAAQRPDLLVLKEIDGYQRGRDEGEVPHILREALLAQGMDENCIAYRPLEIDAVRCALQWSRAGDLLVLPVHSLGARAATRRLLETLAAQGWTAGQPLPPPEAGDAASTCDLSASAPPQA